MEKSDLEGKQAPAQNINANSPGKSSGPGI
jgi:hypothetical protein